MALKVATASRNAMLTALANIFDAANPLNATIKIFAVGPGGSTAWLSSSIDSVDPVSGFSNVLLTTLEFASPPSFASPSGGSMAANIGGGDLTGPIVATGTAVAFLIEDGSGNNIAAGTVGAGTGDLRFDTTSFVNGGTATITALSILIPS